MRQVETLIWGSIRTNGEKYYLLKEEPESPYSVPKWIPDGMTMWLVAHKDDYKVISKEPFVPLFRASHLVFGQDASIELLDNPTVSILVDYFDPEEDEDNNVAVAPTN